MSLFRRKLEPEGSAPANWQSDEVYVRENGEVVRVNPPDTEVDEDASDDKA